MRYSLFFKFETRFGHSRRFTPNIITMATHPPPNKGKPYAVPPRFLIATVVICLTLAGMLVPRKAELVQRLMEDGNHHRARAVALSDDPLLFGRWK